MSTSVSAHIDSSRSVHRFGFDPTAAAEHALAFLDALIACGGVATASPYESSSPPDILPQTVVEHLAEWERAMNPYRLGFQEFDRMPGLWPGAVWDDDELHAAISLTASLGWVLRFLDAESLCGQNLSTLDKATRLRLANPLGHAIWDSATTLLGNKTGCPLPAIFVPPAPCNLSEASIAALDIIVEIWKIRDNLINYRNRDIRQDAYIFWRLGNLEWIHRRMPETGYESCYSAVWTEDGTNSACAHKACIALKQNISYHIMYVGKRLRDQQRASEYAVVYPRDIPLWTPNVRTRAAELIGNFNINVAKWTAQFEIESAKLNCAGVLEDVARRERFIRRPRLGWIGIDPALDVEASGLSCKVILGTTATICPTANPQLPDANLHNAERAIRELYGLPIGSTIHWVGHDGGARGLCRCHPNAPFVGSLCELPHGRARSLDELRSLIGEPGDRAGQLDGQGGQAESPGGLPQSEMCDPSAAGNQPPICDIDPPAEAQRTASEPDGLFEADGFRFAGVEVRFGRATLRYLLITALWDVTTNAPTPSRPVEDVMNEVYGESQETKDSTFRKLVSDTRGVLEEKNCPLNFQCLPGKIQLIPVGINPARKNHRSPVRSPSTIQPARRG